MTTNQIAYFKAKLDERNIEENARHNMRAEQLSAEANAESVRSNKARESINLATLQESERHNKATEGQQWESLRLTESRNMYQNALDASRANLTDTQTKQQMFDYGLNVKYGEVDAILGDNRNDAVQTAGTAVKTLIGLGVLDMQTGITASPPIGDSKFSNVGSRINNISISNSGKQNAPTQVTKYVASKAGMPSGIRLRV